MATSPGTLLLIFTGSFALLKTFSTEVQGNAAYFTKTHTHANCFGTISSHVPSNVPRTPETIRREGPISTIGSELQTESSLRRKKEKPESGQKGKLLPDTLVFLGPRANPTGHHRDKAEAGARSQATPARGEGQTGTHCRRVIPKRTKARH